MTALDRRWAWPVAWIAIGSVIAGAVGLRFDPSQTNEDIPLAIVTVIGATFFAVIGALIASRAGNPIGWLYLAIVLVEGVGLALGAYADVAEARGFALAGYARAFTDPLFLSGLALFVAVFLLFPTGHLASRRWRWVWCAYVAAVAVTFLGFLLQPKAQAADGLGAGADTASTAGNVLGVDALAPVIDPVLAVAGFTIVVAGFAGLVSLVVRFRRGTAEERQQIRWLLAVAILAAAAFIPAVVTGAWVDAAEEAGRNASDALVVVNNVLFFLLVVTIVIGIPLATAVAILRYRLYDLDVVIRKTVVVGLLAVFITGVYAAIVAVASAWFEGSQAGSFAAAAVLALVFAPARDRARRIADRVVYGKRATPYEVLAEFSDRVGEAYDVEDVLGRMAHLLMDGTGGTGARVLLTVGGTEREGAAVGERGDETLVPVEHQGEVLGSLAVSMPASDPMDPARRQLVEDLAAQAGLVLQNVRLIEELRASRQRLVAAQDEERRRLERNIHDGVQQQLVALNVQLGLLGRIVEQDPVKAGGMALQLQSIATETLEDLRDLARGIYPPLLADQGLTAALAAQARKAAVPTTVHADGLDRYDRAVESAVYFSCLEALNNVAKYARASRAEITVANGAGQLRFTVVDDGEGFDATTSTYGTGLQGIADRLAAIGGELEVASTPGGGTTITGRVPVEGGRTT